ncbi:hypothetical protein ACFLZ6_00150 [Nanoarchaeota archaeon]
MGIIKKVKDKLEKEGIIYQLKRDGAKIIIGIFLIIIGLRIYFFFKSRGV